MYGVRQGTMSSNYPRGSEWRKWDLHVHTPLSIENDYASGTEDETWEKYIVALEDLDPTIKVIGVNDYLFIDGYKKLKQAKLDGRLANIDLLLPVVEFRIKIFAGVQFGTTKRINFHVIFDDGDENWIDSIQSKFLNALEHSYYRESGEQWTRSITRDSVEELGREIKSGVPQEELSKYGSDLKEGFNNLNVDEEKIFEILNRDCFSGRYLTAIGKTEWDQLAWSDQSIATKKSIINKASIVFTAAASVEAYSNAKQKLSDQGVNNKLLDCSDAHTYSDSKDKEGNSIKDRLGNCFTWIKADTTFQGLKQIEYEFDERVKVQQSNPYDDNTKYTIDSLSITGSNIVMKQSVPFNRDLIAIIGGKGSGKSLLLSIISAMGDGYIPHDAITDSNTIVDYEFRDKGGTSGQFKSVDISSRTEQNEPIFYVKQEELADKSKNKAAVRATYLKEIGIYDQAANYKSISDVVDRLLGQIYDSETSIDGLKSKTKYCDEVPDGKISFRDFLDKKIDGLKKTIEKTSSKETQDLITAISATIRSGRELKLWIENPGISVIKNDLVAINDKITAFNKKLAGLNIESTLSLINSRVVDEEFKTIEGKIVEKYKSLQNDYLAKQADLKKHEINEDIPVLLKTLEGIQNELALYENAKTELENTEQQIHDRKKETMNLFRKDEGAGIFSAISEEVSNIDQTYQLFSDERKGSPIFQQLFAGVSVEARVFFNHKKLIEDISQCFLKGKAGDIAEWIFNDKQNTYENYFEWVVNGFWDFYEKARENNNLMVRIPGIQLTGAERLLEIIFRKWFDYISVSTAIENDFDGESKEIAKMSTGELATVLLKLKLVTEGLDKQIILLDQPEDHLDNSFIANGLVDLLKKLKKERQVIIATHNANLVVGTDAEQIIIAHGLSNTYTFGGIENPDVKDNIIQILEGGTEAFEKRVNRYK